MNDDFVRMSDEEIARFTQAHQAEAGCSLFDATEFLRAVRSGVTLIERRGYGYALVNPGVERGIAFTPAHLWLIYIAAPYRAGGYGRKLLDEVIAEYAGGRAMTALAHGEERANFFEKSGFRVTEKDPAGEWQRLQYR